MEVEEIKEALEYCRTQIWDKDDLEGYKQVANKEDYECVKYKSDCATTSLKALQNELERVENKPLTIEELKEMIGEPVWINTDYPNAWYIIEKVKDDYIETTEKDLDLFGHTIPQAFSLDENDFYKYKPKEV